MSVVKYRWKGAGDDDGVHYIPMNLPAPKYSWEKPWEEEEDSPEEEQHEEHQDEHQQEEEEQEGMNQRELDEANFLTAISGGKNPEIDGDVVLLDESEFMKEINGQKEVCSEDKEADTLEEDDFMVAISGGKNPMVNDKDHNNEDF